MSKVTDTYYNDIYRVLKDRGFVEVSLDEEGLRFEDRLYMIFEDDGYYYMTNVDDPRGSRWPLINVKDLADKIACDVTDSNYIKGPKPIITPEEFSISVDRIMESHGGNDKLVNACCKVLEALGYEDGVAIIRSLD